MDAHRRLVGSVAVAATLATALLVACSSAGDSNASCVGPYLDDQPPSGQHGAPAPTASSGDTLTIYGHSYPCVSG